MEKIIYLKISWMQRYEGLKNDDATGDFRYVKDGETPHEIYNFKVENDNKCYGYSPVNPDIKKRFGANGEQLEGMTIIWVAKNPKIGGKYIVGWYKNATLYRNRKALSDFNIDRKIGKKNDGIFIASAKSQDCVLLSENQRNFIIQGFGQKPAYYGNKELNSDVLNYIEDNSGYIAADIQMIGNDKTISKTEKERFIAARLGQGKFKKDVCNIENGCCRVTGVDDVDFLIASHIKPWCECSNQERLDKYNGFLLSPHIDKLFDRGYISFEDNGDILVSEKAREVIQIWNIHIKNVGTFHPK